MVSFSRKQWFGLSFLFVATGLSVHEHLSHTSVENLNPETVLIAQHDLQKSSTHLPLLTAPILISASQPILEEKEETLCVSKGSTMVSLLTQQGVHKDEAIKAIEALKRVYDVRDLKVGQDVHVKFLKDSSKKEISLKSISLKISGEHEIFLNAHKDGTFLAKKNQITLQKVQHRVEGTIGSSFYSAALKKGIPSQIIREAISALSHSVNWQHDPSQGDPFTLVYDAYQDKQGNIVKVDHLRYVSFAPSKRNYAHQIYRFQPKNGMPGYYDANGMSVKRSLLQTPIDPLKMRLTSKFSASRRHPILGYSKAHKGVDFGAAVGTPVRAAGDGVVVKACYWGNYGNIVQIKHNNEYTTAYAHLNRIKVRVGERVRQNQLIGNVGSTGRTTGPHLHYEVIRNGVHVNPQSTKLMPTAKLGSKDLADFRRAKSQIEKQMETPLTRVASAENLVKVG